MMQIHAIMAIADALLRNIFSYFSQDILSCVGVGWL